MNEKDSDKNRRIALTKWLFHNAGPLAQCVDSATCETHQHGLERKRGYSFKEAGNADFLHNMGPWTISRCICAACFSSFHPLLSFASSAAATQHGSLTVTIWIQSHRSLSALHGHVGNLHHYRPSLPCTYIYLFYYLKLFIFSVINPFIFHLLPSLNSMSLCLSTCLSVSASAGHAVYQRSARRQRLRPDGWHLQPMVGSRRLGGREEECLREEHVCVFFLQYTSCMCLRYSWITVTWMYCHLSAFIRHL